MRIAVNNAANNNKGFSLIEVMISTAILASVLSVVSMSMISMTQTASVEMLDGALDMRLTRTQTFFESELMDCAIIAPSGTIASSFIQVNFPVDLDGDGNMSNEITTGTFGIVYPNGVAPQTGYIEYRFSPYTDGRSPVSEATLNQDINQDQDQNDVFILGRLEKEWNGDSTGQKSLRVVDGVVQVEQSTGVYGGDITGDGTNNPLFSKTAGNDLLQIEIFLLGRSDQGNRKIYGSPMNIAIRN